MVEKTFKKIRDAEILKRLDRQKQGAGKQTCKKRVKEYEPISRK